MNMVDKNLFPYDLAVVAIIKNEGAYLKEWLDYHLLAGVDHFYLFDNDSPDNQAEVAAPYVEAGLVDYIPAPGKLMQYAVYNETVKRFRFQCRYMAFIDADEFILPKTNQSIVETLDEILSRNFPAAGMAINWQWFGSNGHETADLTRGVLERFTRRAPTDWAPDNLFGNAHIKTVTNPRVIRFIKHPHYACYFYGAYSINENGMVVPKWCNFPVTAEKIVVNHYYPKSREEYAKKVKRGAADGNNGSYSMEHFELSDRNEVFDDGILNYRAARAQNFSLPSDDERFKRVTKTLTRILSAYSAGEKLSMETVLTCRALSNRLGLKAHEEAAVAAILNSLNGLSLVDGHMLIRELPQLLCLPYPAVKYLRGVAVQIVIDFMDVARTDGEWQYYVELDYLMDILKLGG